MTILSTPHFDKEAKALLKKYPSLPDDLELLFESLQTNPLQGTPLGMIVIKFVQQLNQKEKVNQAEREL